MCEANPYKKVYYKLLLELREAPNDIEIKRRVLEAGNQYYSKIKTFGMGSFRGDVTSARAKTLIGPFDEKDVI